MSSCAPYSKKNGMNILTIINMDSQAPPNKLATGHDANKPSGGNALKTSARKRECGHCGNTLTNNSEQMFAELSLAGRDFAQEGAIHMASRYQHLSKQSVTCMACSKIDDNCLLGQKHSARLPTLPLDIHLFQTYQRYWCLTRPSKGLYYS